jgi:hypothetical protein
MLTGETGLAACDRQGTCWHVRLATDVGRADIIVVAISSRFLDYRKSS